MIETITNSQTFFKQIIFNKYIWNNENSLLIQGDKINLWLLINDDFDNFPIQFSNQKKLF